jgi:hypothetical protein
MNHILARAAAVLAAITTALPVERGFTQMNTDPVQTSKSELKHPYAGMWITADGRVRHNLLPNGRYDEARGNRESAYQGRYEVAGNHIEYWDDTGFTADGDFIDGVLHHGGMILYRHGTAPVK